MRVTHTFALMEVSNSTFNEIESLLRKAQYEHMFEEEKTPAGKRVNGIAMQGIMLVRSTQSVEPAQRPESKGTDDVRAALESLGILPDQIAPSEGKTGVMCPGLIDPTPHKELGEAGDDENFMLPK